MLINKALIEIPPKFRDQPPVFPGLADSEIRHVEGRRGPRRGRPRLRRSGCATRPRSASATSTRRRRSPTARKATVIAWIWARTVTCPNPACGIEMPLVRSWWLGKKKGKEAYVVPQSWSIRRSIRSGGAFEFEIGHDPATAPTPTDDGTVGRTGATCVACETVVSPRRTFATKGRASRLGAAADGDRRRGQRRRVYLAPDRGAQRAAADVDRARRPFRMATLGYKPARLQTSRPTA